MILIFLKEGAIFADSNSKTFLFGCTYKKAGDNIFVNDNAFVFINTTLENVNSVSNYVFKKSEKSSLCVKSLDISNPPIFEVEVYNVGDFINALNTPHYDTWGKKIYLHCNINLPEDVYFIIDEPVEIISYEGEKYSINDDEDSNFLINKQGSLQIKNTKIPGCDLVFNNYGNVRCVNTYFDKNDFVMKNYGGYFNFTSCVFDARRGSIYSEGKTISHIVNCKFIDGEGLSFWETMIKWVPGVDLQEVNIFSLDSKIVVLNTTCSYECDEDEGGIISKRNTLDSLIKYINVSDSKSLRDAGSKVWQDKVIVIKL